MVHPAEKDGGDDGSPATPDVFPVKRIIGHRHDRNGNIEFNVEWEGPYEATWEPRQNILDERLLRFYWKSVNEKKTGKEKPSPASSSSAPQTPASAKKPTKPRSSGSSSAKPTPTRRKRRVSDSDDDEDVKYKDGGEDDDFEDESSDSEESSAPPSAKKAAKSKKPAAPAAPAGRASWVPKPFHPEIKVGGQLHIASRPWAPFERHFWTADPESEDVRWLDLCAACNLGGSLLCCESCYMVYHWDCLESPPPEDQDLWWCPTCVWQKSCCRVCAGPPHSLNRSDSADPLIQRVDSNAEANAEAGDGEHDKELFFACHRCRARMHKDCIPEAYRGKAYTNQQCHFCDDWGLPMPAGTTFGTHDPVESILTHRERIALDDSASSPSTPGKPPGQELASQLNEEEDLTASADSSIALYASILDDKKKVPHPYVRNDRLSCCHVLTQCLVLIHIGDA